MTTIEKLLRLQAHDLSRVRVEDELGAMPRRKAEVEALLAEEAARIETSKQAAKQAEAAVKLVETEVESYREKITRYRQQQVQIKSNTEYRALEDEIAAAQEKIKGLEDRELEAMERGEQARRAHKLALAQYERHKRETDQELAAFAGRAQALEAECARLAAERGALAAEIESAWLRRYERVFQHTRAAVLAPVDGGACGGCRMKLTAQVVQDTRRGQALVCCEYCGRILYAPT